MSDLVESVKHEWSGDVDLGDGAVQKEYATYLERLEFVDSLQLTCDDKCLEMLSALKGVHTQLINDRDFIDSGMKRTPFSHMISYFLPLRG